MKLALELGGYNVGVSGNEMLARPPAAQHRILLRHMHLAEGLD